MASFPQPTREEFGEEQKSLRSREEALQLHINLQAGSYTKVLYAQLMQFYSPDFAQKMGFATEVRDLGSPQELQDRKVGGTMWKLCVTLARIHTAYYP